MNAAIWKSAEEAIVAGDVATLERLLREHGDVLRKERPRSSSLGGLTPEYSGADARAIIVRNHEFETWDEFASHAEALKEATSTAARFEAAVDAVVDGNVESLQRLLERTSDLVRARSARKHHSTLLHYVGANGVEGFRQRTPPTAVEIANTLLEAGAEVDAAADMYGGGQTTLGLVATSFHPRAAGLQNALIDILLAHGARMTPQGLANRRYPLVNGCLANGRPEAAEHLASRGAPLDLEGAAGVGRLDLVKSFFTSEGALKPPATLEQMRDGFTWACEYGRTLVVEYLLDRGIAVGEQMPRPHGQTGLHWAAYGGHVDTVKALLKRHAPVDVKDRTFDGTPLDWALHAFSSNPSEAAAKNSYYHIVALLVAAGAPVARERLTEESARANPRMFAALTGKMDSAGRNGSRR